MLVYYLKEKTLVGRTGSKQDPDIQLSGVGIQDEHCEINVDPDDWTVTLVPYAGSRTCINGVEVSVPTLLRNGDRIFWGSNHFFRINCPKTTNNPSDPGTIRHPKSISRKNFFFRISDQFFLFSKYPRMSDYF